MARYLFNSIWSKIRNFIPTPLRYFIRIAYYKLWLLKIRYNNISAKDIFDFTKVFYVSPEFIRYSTPAIFGKGSSGKRILKGDWSTRDRIVFDSLPIYNAFLDRYIHNKKWEDTEFYKITLKDIRQGQEPWNCKNENDLKTRLYEEIDSLYHNIKTNGYKSQQEIYHGTSKVVKIYDEVTTQIASDGNFLFEDGLHRLCIAKILNIPRIPVVVSARHYDWFLFKKILFDYAKKEGGKIYQKLPHPDLEDIPYSCGDFTFEQIKASLDFFKGDLLDIGANVGYYTHRFEELGFNCFAVEAGRFNAYIMRKLRDALNRKFMIFQQSIFDFSYKTDFDIILALRIFHHFLKERSSYGKFKRLLQRLHTKVMYFIPHLKHEDQMKNAYVNYDNKEFVNFIIANSNLSNFKEVGRDESGRPIYKITE